MPQKRLLIQCDAESQLQTLKNHLKAWECSDEIDIVAATETSDILFSSRGICPLPDWNLTSIPFIFPQHLPVSKSLFRFVCDYKNEAYERLNVEDVASFPLLKAIVEAVSLILNQSPIAPDFFDHLVPQTQFEEYAIAHNKALLLHYYFQNSGRIEDVQEQFKYTAYLAPDPLWMSYSHYLYMIFLLENHLLDNALEVAYQVSRRAVPPTVKSIVFLSLYKTLCSETYLENVDARTMNEMSLLLDETTRDLPMQRMDFLQQKSLYAEAHHQLDDAESALKLAIEISQRLHHPQQYALHQSLGDIYLKQAQFGNTHSYISSQKSYQEALKFLTKDRHPLAYAHCQMNLGIIYTEMPSFEKKKHIYAGLAQAAFSEALALYNPQDYPYQYASVCNNFANALMSLLPDLDEERIAKIEYYITQSLNLRQRSTMPEERAMTLLTLLQLYFKKIQSVDSVPATWHEEMQAIANEILELTSHPFLVEKANETLQLIQHHLPSSCTNFP